MYILIVVLVFVNISIRSYHNILHHINLNYNYTTLYCIILHYIALYYIILNFNTLYYIILNYITLYYIHKTTLYYTTLSYIFNLYYIICWYSRIGIRRKFKGSPAKLGWYNHGFLGVASSETASWPMYNRYSTYERSCKWLSWGVYPLTNWDAHPSAWVWLRGQLAWMRLCKICYI